MRELWERGQRGWPAEFPLVQFPNAPLIAFFAAALLTRVTDDGARDAANAVSKVALTIWAYEEAARGANWVRRLLGAIVLAAVVVGLALERR